MNKVNLKYKGQQFVIEYHDKWFSRSKIMKIYEVMVDNHNTKNGFGCVCLHKMKVNAKWFRLNAQRLYIYKEILDKVYFTNIPPADKSIFNGDFISLDEVKTPRKIGYKWYA